MNKTILGGVVLVSGVGLLTVACGHQYDTQARTSQTTAAAQTRDPNDAAIEKLVSAKCERETRCNNVGAGKKFGNHQACLDDNRASKRADLRSADCPGGIDQRKLEGCLSEIRAERCENVLDTISRLNSCRDGALCIN